MPESPRQILNTKRLTLRELVESDLDRLAPMLGDREVMRYWPAPLTREEARAWIAKQHRRYAEDGFGYWLIERKEDGAAIGQAGIMFNVIDGAREHALGYIIDRPYWRQGYAFEAAQACIDYAFKEIGAVRIVAPVRPENEPSAALARKLGMQVEKRTVVHGYEHDVYVWGSDSRRSL